MYNFSIELNDNVEQIIKKYCKILKDNGFSYRKSYCNRYLGQIKINYITYSFKKRTLRIEISKDLIKNKVSVGCYENDNYSKKLPLCCFEDILNYI